jgi:hypothetical protein
MTFYNIKGRGRSKLEPVDPNKGILRPTPKFQTRIKCEMIVPDQMARFLYIMKYTYDINKTKNYIHMHEKENNIRSWSILLFCSIDFGIIQ